MVRRPQITNRVVVKTCLDPRMILDRKITKPSVRIPIGELTPHRKSHMYIRAIEEMMVGIFAPLAPCLRMTHIAKSLAGEMNKYVSPLKEVQMD